MAGKAAISLFPPQYFPKGIPDDRASAFPPAESSPPSQISVLDYEILMRSAATRIEQYALMAVYACTVADGAPRVPLSSLLYELRDIDHWDVRIALAKLDRDRIIRMVNDGLGTTWISIRRPQALAATSGERH